MNFFFSLFFLEESFQLFPCKAKQIRNCVCWVFHVPIDCNACLCLVSDFCRILTSCHDVFAMHMFLLSQNYCKKKKSYKITFLSHKSRYLYFQAFSMYLRVYCIHNVVILPNFLVFCRKFAVQLYLFIFFHLGYVAVFPS